MKNKPSRRHFLQGGLSSLGALSLGGAGWSPNAWANVCAGFGQALAAPQSVDRHYIFCYFLGAWDVLLSLDPRDPALFSEENMAITQIQPGYSLCSGVENGALPHEMTSGTDNGQAVSAAQPALLGPFFGDLRNHWDKMAIVRGMSMDTLTHEVGRRRFLTGRQPNGLLARGASIATWLAALIEQQAMAQGQSPKLIPNLAIKTESYNDCLPVWASGMKVNSLADLQQAFYADHSLFNPELQKLVDAIHAEHFACASAAASPTLSGAGLAHTKMQAIINDPNLAASFDFGADTPDMAALRATFCGAQANQSSYSQGQCLQQSEMLAAAAATALISGVSRVVSLQPHSNGLDTHFDNWADVHGQNLRQGFNTMARIVEHLSSEPYPSNDGSSWMDHTTILAFSDFGRTPLLNDRGGRDHHLTNSCLVLGQGIQGQTICGRSSDVGMMPTYMNLDSGEGGLATPSEGVEIVKPEHVLQSLIYDAGFTEDPADLRVPPIPALLKQG